MGPTAGTPPPSTYDQFAALLIEPFDVPAPDSVLVGDATGFVRGDVSETWGQAYCVPDAVAFTGVDESRRADRETIVAGFSMGRR